MTTGELNSALHGIQPHALFSAEQEEPFRTQQQGAGDSEFEREQCYPGFAAIFEKDARGGAYKKSLGQMAVPTAITTV